MLVLKLLWFAYGENATHIVKSVHAAFACLAGGVFLSVEVTADNGFGHCFGHGFADKLALVVAAPELSPPMEGHGDDVVYVVKAA